MHSVSCYTSCSPVSRPLPRHNADVVGAGQARRPASTADVNDRIPRDLETICLKAMDKEPSRRYGKAVELSADLRRWLNGETIKAQSGKPS